MSYSESKFQTDFNTWKRYNLKKTCAEELKITKTNRFNLSAIEYHQVLNLTNAHKGFFQFKIPDLGNQNPFDSFSLYKVPAYVVVLFYKSKQPKIFYGISINIINNLIEEGIKSITYKEAEELAEFVGEIR